MEHKEIIYAHAPGRSEDLVLTVRAHKVKGVEMLFVDDGEEEVVLDVHGAKVVRDAAARWIKDQEA